jgi:outer membrane receptor protein involved in Fe transport
VPYVGGLLSVSWFNKIIEDPIEYLQVPDDFTFTTARNYPEGHLSGFEAEVRQGLEQFHDGLRGLSVGANATLIDSEVQLPADEQAALANVQAPMDTREMTNAPEHLYNFYATLDLEEIDTEVGLFYTIQGDTLVAGAGVAQNTRFVPSVYAEEYGTLNLVVEKGLGEGVELKFQAKNLTNPEITEVYRSDFVPGGDVTKSSYHKGLELTIGISASF